MGEWAGRLLGRCLARSSQTERVQVLILGASQQFDQGQIEDDAEGEEPVEVEASSAGLDIVDRGAWPAESFCELGLCPASPGPFAAHVGGDEVG